MRDESTSMPAEAVKAGLDRLADTDVVGLGDVALREQVLELLTIVHRSQAELGRRVDVFDRRGLAEADGFRTTRSWLQAFGRLSGAAAQRLMKVVRVLRGLPGLSAATQSGDVSEEHLRHVATLSERVGSETVREVEPVLVEAAQALDPARFAVVCERVRAHVAPDGSDPGRAFESRTLTLSPVAGMVAVRGQLDPEGGAALATALDALMAPPAPDEGRSAGQRRADALVELARLPLSVGDLPSVGGQRPQVGVLVHPQALSPETLARLAEAQQGSFGARRLREFAADLSALSPSALSFDGFSFDGFSSARWDISATGSGGDGAAAACLSGMDAGWRSHARDERSAVATLFGRTVEDLRRHVYGDSGDDSERNPTSDPQVQSGVGTGSRASPGRSAGRVAWEQPGWADPPWLNWIGPVAPEVAQRLACDSDVFRIVMDPANGMPLDVGRSHRLVPYWMRRALWARDRGCRWIGCTARVEWTDAHHVTPWADGGETSVERCLLLCRYHHSLVHEGGWSIDLDPRTGQVAIQRPGGSAYSLAGSSATAPASSWTGTSTGTTLGGVS